MYEQKFYSYYNKDGFQCCVQDTGHGIYNVGWMKRCPMCKKRFDLVIKDTSIPQKIFEKIEPRVVFCKKCTELYRVHGIRYFVGGERAKQIEQSEQLARENIVREVVAGTDDF